MGYSHTKMYINLADSLNICWNFPDSVSQQTIVAIALLASAGLAPCKEGTKYFIPLTKPSRSADAQTVHPIFPEYTSTIAMTRIQ